MGVVVEDIGVGLDGLLDDLRARPPAWPNLRFLVMTLGVEVFDWTGDNVGGDGDNLGLDCLAGVGLAASWLTPQT